MTIQHNVEQLGNAVIFLAPGLLLVAEHQDGQLVRSMGTTCKVEQIEMNHVKVTKGDAEAYYEIGDKVRWLEVQ